VGLLLYDGQRGWSRCLCALGALSQTSGLRASVHGATFKLPPARSLGRTLTGPKHGAARSQSERSEHLQRVDVTLLHGAARRSAHSFTCRCIVYGVYVGRRGRQREHQAEQRARMPRDRMARVQVSDETWAAYRAALGATPVSVALGRLVEREVASRRRRTAADGDGVRAAVRDARAVVDELQALIARLEVTAASRGAPSGAQ
jgi:hypothetical protein